MTSSLSESTHRKFTKSCLLFSPIALVLALLLQTRQCYQIDNCAGCARSSGCSWCNAENKCRSTLDLNSQCSVLEGVLHADHCSCSCKPHPGANISVCEYYTTVSDSIAPDPSAWLGGDYLPKGYREAAFCVCSSAPENSSGSHLRVSENADFESSCSSSASIVKSCIRESLLAAHRSLSPSIKQALRHASTSNDVSTLLEYLPLFYDAHVDAYKECCCVGKPAPYYQWVLLLWLGDRLSCSVITELIYLFGRCGCGW